MGTRTTVLCPAVATSMPKPWLDMNPTNYFFGKAFKPALRIVKAGHIDHVRRPSRTCLRHGHPLEPACNAGLCKWQQTWEATDMAYSGTVNFRVSSTDMAPLALTQNDLSGETAGL